MSKTTLVAVLAVGTAGAVGAGLPYYTGVVAERQFQQAFDEVSNHPLTSARQTDYRRGWLSSEAASELTVRIGEHTFVFPCRHSIVHGLASARVTTVAQLPEGMPAELRELFGEDFVTAVTTIRANGDQYTEIHSAAVDTEASEDGRVEWGGLTGTLALEDGRFETDLTLPHLRLSSDDGRIAFEQMTVRGDLERFSSRAWLGDSRFELARFELDVPVKELDGEHAVFRMSGLEVAQAQREDGPDLLRFEMAVKVDEMAAEQAAPWTDLIWDADVRNVDRAAYLDFVDRIATADPSAAPEALGLEMMQMIAADAQTFLERSPRIEFTRLGVSGLEGRFEGDFSIDFDGGDGFTFTMPELLARVSMQAHARMPQSMFEQILAQAATGSAEAMAEQYPEATEAEIATLAEEIRHNQLDQLRASGLLVADGDYYTLEASYSQGFLEVNGIPMNGLLGQ